MEKIKVKKIYNSLLEVQGSKNKSYVYSKLNSSQPRSSASHPERTRNTRVTTQAAHRGDDSSSIKSLQIDGCYHQPDANLLTPNLHLEDDTNP